MREAPAWFQAELTRIGGVNPYGEPVFKLVWSTEPRRVIGGRFQKDGFTGYRQAPEITGPPCWALMVWEPRETQGTRERWERDYRDEETGLLDCGPYPRFGRYRLLQRFLHTEIVQQPMEKHGMLKDGTLYKTVIQTRKVRQHRMGPCGFMLDIMVPMLKAWRRLSDAAKIAALRQEEAMRKEEFLKKVKDARDGCRISRGSRLVQQRAEMIERGFRQAMAKAAQFGLGMAVSQGD